MRKLDLTGRRFGSLVAIKSVVHKGRLCWECVCDCGGSTTVMTSNLTRGNSKTCGCSKQYLLRTHGRYKHPCYLAWRSMLRRCEIKAASDYARYGGRGIVVCNAWHDIEQFIADVGLPPTAQHTIDRIDVDGNYEPYNCRWATRKEQARNKRNTIRLEGISLADWCEKYKFPYKLAYARFTGGMSPSEILSTPEQLKNKGSLCSEEDCQSPAKTKGLCNRHYLREWKRSQS